MTTTFIPEFGPGEPVQVVQEERMLNRPPDGTRMRATLATTVIEGTLTRAYHPRVLTLLIEGSTHLTLYVTDKWRFEVLDEEIVGHAEFQAVDG